MRIAVMRNIDRYAGVPLCWMLGIVRTLFGRHTPSHEIRNILIVKFFGIGSIVLATPALSVLRNAYPHARIDFLTFESNRLLLERYLMIDHVLTIRASSLSRFLSDTFRIIVDLRRTSYDAVFDFEFFSKFSTLLSSLSGATHRIGFALPARWRAMHLTHQA